MDRRDARETGDLTGLMRDIGRCPKYTRDEVMGFAHRWAYEADVDAREQMILSVLPWAMSRAKAYRNTNIRLDDAMSLAFEAVIRAVDTFRPELGYSLMTYVTQVIYRWLQRSEGEVNHVIRLPPKPTDLEKANRVRTGVISISFENRDWDEVLPMAMSAGDEAAENDEIRAKARKVAELHRLIDGLPERERHVILARLRGETLGQVGITLRVTRERVRQIEQLAMQHLKTAAVSNARDGIVERWLIEELDGRDVMEPESMTLLNLLNQVTLKQVDSSIELVERDFAAARNVHDARRKALDALRDAIKSRYAPIVGKLSTRGRPRSTVNLDRIVHYLREHGPATNREIIEATGIGGSSVSAILTGCQTTGTFARCTVSAADGGAEHKAWRLADCVGQVAEVNQHAGEA
jgi:RNA polymerase primary sigma factor